MSGTLSDLSLTYSDQNNIQPGIFFFIFHWLFAYIFSAYRYFLLTDWHIRTI